MGALSEQEERERRAREELERRAPDGMTGDKLRRWVTEQLRARVARGEDPYASAEQEAADRRADRYESWGEDA